MSLLHHSDRAGENIVMTVGTIATAAGGIDGVRDSFHLLAGVWGDLAGIFVSVLTIIWWTLKVADTVLLKWRAYRAPALPRIGGPLGDMEKP